jgi:hypothetical protein
VSAIDFPGAWQHYPPEVRRFLLAKVMEKQLEIQDGPAGVIEWLYRGTTRRPEEVTLKMAKVTGEIHYNTRADQLWTLVVADARAWAIARAKPELGAPGA